MQKKVIILVSSIVIIGFIFQMVLQWKMRPSAIDGMYFQKWTSENLMQTVSIEDLRDRPFQSLLNIHIQPPGLDIIRTLLVHVWNSSDSQALLRKVDQSLYILWALLYSFLGAIVFLWLSETTSMRFAYIATLLFFMHPAGIYYATLLDSSILTTFLITYAYFILWRINKEPEKSLIPLTLIVLALFFTRSLFQWQAIFIFAITLFLFKVPYRRIALFLIIAGGIAGLYTAKQHYQFGISSTSSFVGLNLARSIDLNTDRYWNYLDNYPLNSDDNSLPSVLVRRKKIDGSTNFNNLHYLQINREFMTEYTQSFRAGNLVNIGVCYLKNLWIYFKPSSKLNRNAIVSRIPWRTFYDTIFSFPILPLLIIIAAVAWFMTLRRRDYAGAVAICLPGLFIFLLSILCEKGENMRFKFFIEPVVFIFLAIQFYAISTSLYHKIQSRYSTRHTDDKPVR